MSTLSPEGRRLVDELARRHGFGEPAVAHALDAVAAGGGRMAQFSHPELGGSGQWMAGGMLMIGDLFDAALKARVGALLADLAGAFDGAGPAGGDPGGSAQAQRQVGVRRDEAGAASGPALFETPPAGTASAGAWWPAELGTPAASGAQDATRYAWFPDARRLALDVGGEVRVHDTLDHRIGGFSQQQGARDGLAFTSQHGTVDPASLPLVSGDGRSASRASGSGGDGGGGPEERGAARPASAGTVAADRPEPSGASAGPSVEAAPDARVPGDLDPIRAIEGLGRLLESGLLTEEEFAGKKRELLARL